MWKSTRDDMHTSRGIGVSHLIDLVAASEAARVWVLEAWKLLDGRPGW